MTTQATAPADQASNQGEAKSFVRFLPHAARILQGLIFAGAGIFGLLLAFGVLALPQPKEPQPAAATALFEAFVKTGYLLALLKAVETIGGLLLLANRYVPLALAMLAPIVVNILALHAIVAPSGLPIALIVFALEIYLAWAYRDAYRPMLAARATARATPGA